MNEKFITIFFQNTVFFSLFNIVIFIVALPSIQFFVVLIALALLSLGICFSRYPQCSILSVLVIFIVILLLYSFSIFLIYFPINDHMTQATLGILANFDLISDYDYLFTSSRLSIEI